MALQFPTIAEQAVEKFEKSTKTISFATIAKKLGGERIKPPHFSSDRIFVFDDDTSLVITGRGKSHKYHTELP